MVIESARKAIKGVFDGESRLVLLKSLGLTVLLFLGIWLGIHQLVTAYLLPYVESWTWLAAAIMWFLGAGVFVGAGFLLAPTTAIFAGIFLDDIARHIEEIDYPQHPVGQPLEFSRSFWISLKFTFFVLFANLLALLLTLLPGVNFAIFFVLNGYLLGQEYFKFAAMRFRTEQNTKTLRKKFGLEIFMAGLIVAVFMSIPLLNFLTPLFAAGLMVHLHKAITLQIES